MNLERGIFSSVLFLVLLLSVPSVVSIDSIIAQGQTADGFPQSIIVSSSTNTTPHLLKLKATQQGGAETRISGFSVDMTGAVSAQANSQLLVLVTDSSLRVIEAKVRTASNQVIDLVPVASSQQATGAFSLANLPGGVYTLDVITQKGSAKAAYEGVLSIGNQPVTVIEETTKRVTNDYGDLIIIFEPHPCDLPNPPPECLLEDPCLNPNPPPECEEIEERPICTPDGPPCPPCPPGVEAGWCADEDERQDTDDGLGRDIPGPEVIDEDDTPVPEDPESGPSDDEPEEGVEQDNESTDNSEDENTEENNSEEQSGSEFG